MPPVLLTVTVATPVIVVVPANVIGTDTLLPMVTLLLFSDKALLKVRAAEASRFVLAAAAVPVIVMAFEDGPKALALPRITMPWFRLVVPV